MMLGYSPDGRVEAVEFFRGLDHLLVVVGQDTGAQIQTHVPIVLHFLQAALPPQQAAQGHTWGREGEGSFTNKVISFFYNMMTDISLHKNLFCKES